MPAVGGVRLVDAQIVAALLGGLSTEVASIRITTVVAVDRPGLTCAQRSSFRSGRVDVVMAACYHATMTCWFTSDLHLGHARVRDLVPLRGESFSDLDHMNTELVRRWNERVLPDDVVYCLGDMVMGQREKTLPMLSRLNGRKLLVMGNHDYCWPHLWKTSQAEKAQRWKDAYWPYFKGLFTEISMPLSDGTHVHMHHFPYLGDSHAEDRYADHRPKDLGVPLLHGHVHDAWRTATTPAGTPMVNVGVDVNGFAPVSEQEILSLLS